MLGFFLILSRLLCDLPEGIAQHVTNLMDLFLVPFELGTVNDSQYIELLDHLIEIAADTPDLEDQ